MLSKAEQSQVQIEYEQEHQRVRTREHIEQKVSEASMPEHRKGSIGCNLMMMFDTEQEKVVSNEHLQNFKTYLSCMLKEGSIQAE